jgi:hypothetical protein
MTIKVVKLTLLPSVMVGSGRKGITIERKDKALFRQFFYADTTKNESWGQAD